jgi:alpha-beta hydrolase superfamily lysophospholipase
MHAIQAVHIHAARAFGYIMRMVRRNAALAATLLSLVACGGPPNVPARAPSDLSPTTKEVEHTSGFFDGHGGAHLFEQAWRPADGRVRASFVIMHGLKDHSSRYEELALALVARGFAVHAFDMRGHAHSDGVRVGVDSFEDYVADLDVFVSRVAREEHDAPTIVFGHSMGGAIATLYALERKPQIAGLVLSGAALKVDADAAVTGAAKLTASLNPNAGIFQLDMNNFSRDAKVVAACKADPFVYQDPAPAHTLKELLAAIDTIDEHMDDLFVPLLILHGAADQVTPPAGSKELYDRTPSSDRTLHLYPNLVHDLVHEPEKAQVIGDIVNWSDRHVRAIEERKAAGSRGGERSHS